MNQDTEHGRMSGNDAVLFKSSDITTNFLLIRYMGQVPLLDCLSESME